MSKPSLKNCKQPAGSCILALKDLSIQRKSLVQSKSFVSFPNFDFLDDASFEIHVHTYIYTCVILNIHNITLHIK